MLANKDTGVEFALVGFNLMLSGVEFASVGLSLLLSGVKFAAPWGQVCGCQCSKNYLLIYQNRTSFFQHLKANSCSVRPKKCILKTLYI